MNPKDAEDLRLALVSAFVWVASADEGVTMDEYTKFQHIIVGSPFATHFDLEDLRHSFKSMVSVFESNFDKGIELTRERLSNYSSNTMPAEEIVRLARAAAIADGELKPVEENVLNQIAKELGLDHQA